MHIASLNHTQGWLQNLAKKSHRLPVDACRLTGKASLCGGLAGTINACMSAQNLLSVQGGHLLSSHQLNHTLYCLFKRFICHLRSFLGRGRAKGINLGPMFTSKCERSSVTVPQVPGTWRHLRGASSWGRMFSDVETVILVPVVCCCHSPLSVPLPYLSKPPDVGASWSELAQFIIRNSQTLFVLLSAGRFVVMFPSWALPFEKS